jgi:ABC-type bacteriocin/lantibiotic exporter with double-glycine peptidase domain
MVLTMITINYLTIADMVANKMSVGGIILVNSYIYQIMRPLEGLALNYRNLSRSFNDFKLFIVELNRNAAPYLGRGIPSNVHKIVLKNVSKPGVLKNLNLTLRKGEMVAILGKSGSGKTTLLNIIANIERNYNGEVYYDNENVTNFKWNNNFPSAYLNADARLLLQTPHSNLMLSDSARDDRIEYCLQQASLDSELLVNDGCETLSTGEKQRLLIARTLLMAKNIRFFDESFSAIDHETQVNILKNIRKDNKECIVIFVTHNERLVDKFDRVIRVADGCIFEESKASALNA